MSSYRSPLCVIILGTACYMMQLGSFSMPVFGEDIYPIAIWSGGTIGYNSFPDVDNPLVGDLYLMTTDSDEGVQIAGPIPSPTEHPYSSDWYNWNLLWNEHSINLADFVLSSDLDGSVASSGYEYSPFFGYDSAIGVALYENPFVFQGTSLGGTIRSYFQIRMAGSQATVQDTSLAADAVAAGLWSSVDDYIEFEPQYAGYGTGGYPPTGPADYGGFILPEPTSACLWAIGFAGLLARRKRH